ncbi:MAG: hypothetical protein ACFE8A_09350 [Candidatus Hodarchaeota archaeon]
MTETENDQQKMEKIKQMIGEGRIDDTVDKISFYLGQSTEENYIDRLENVIETISPLHGGKTVIRFLIEHNIIDVPGLLEHLSKRDPLLRYSFLLLLKDICENEGDLFLPYSENLLNSDDPNVREANLQLLIFMLGGEKISIDQESLIEAIASKLKDEKDFVAEKAIQVLKTIGKKSPSIITRILTDYTKECPENEALKNRIDDVLKSIVTIEKIEEIVEEEEGKILERERELKKKEMELKKEKLDLEEKVTELEEKAIVEKEKALKIKKELLKGEEIELIEKARKEIIPEGLKRSEISILDKELELKKKDLEIKKKKLKLEEKEKELEKKAIQEREKALKLKEELIEKEKQLSQVELELKRKEIKEKEREILEKEAQKVDKKSGENDSKSD